MTTWIHALERRLTGWPDTALSAALVAVGLGLIVVALTAPATVKALALAWAVLP